MGRVVGLIMNDGEREGLIVVTFTFVALVAFVCFSTYAWWVS